jgi:peptidoglycan hydrolase-like protein with peptidoglycan-binding domain
MDVTLVDLKSLDNEQVRQLQQTLQERGHYRGNVDGIVGPQTRSALTALLAEQYSLNQRLVNQGQITQQLAQSIGIDAQGRTPVSGVDSPPNQMNMPSTSPSPSQQRTSPSTRSFPSSPSGQQPSSPSMDDTSSPPDDSRTGDDSMDHNAPHAPR